MRNRIMAGWGILAVAAVMLGSTAHALPLPALTITGGTSQAAFDNNTLGYRFTALANTSVVSLGIWDDLGNGLAEAHAVGLWNNAGTLLASITVAGGTSALLDSGFRWADLNAIDIVQLAAGTTYTVAAYYDANNDDQVATFRSIAVDSRISYGESAQGSAGGLGFPTGTCCNAPPSSTHYYGGNVRLADVPEPTTFALLAIGVLGASFTRRRRTHH